jgi:hypothetical protein
MAELDGLLSNVCFLWPIGSQTSLLLVLPVASHNGRVTSMDLDQKQERAGKAAKGFLCSVQSVHIKTQKSEVIGTRTLSYEEDEERFVRYWLGTRFCMHVPLMSHTYVK